MQDAKGKILTTNSGDITGKYLHFSLSRPSTNTDHYLLFDLSCLGFPAQLPPARRSSHLTPTSSRTDIPRFYPGC